MEIHLPNGVELKLECDDVQPDTRPIAFTLVDCSSVTVKGRSVDDICSFPESPSLTDCNRSQYSDQDHTGTPNKDEEDAVDPIFG